MVNTSKHGIDILICFKIISIICVTWLWSVEKSGNVLENFQAMITRAKYHDGAEFT